MSTGSDFHGPGSNEPRGESTGTPHEPPRPQASGFFPWIRSLEIRRNESDRWFAGVASGIANKAGVDPLIVRGVFVVLALIGGPGILLYLVGWLFLPDTTGRIHFEEMVRGRATPGVIIATVFIAVWLIAGIFSGGTFGVLRWDVWNVFGVPEWLNVTFSWIFWIVVCAGVAYLVHLAILQHGKSQGARTSPPAAAPSSTPSDQPHGSAHAESEGETQQSFSETVNEWGQTMSERANSWSAEYASRHERLRLGRAHALITVALALIAAGVAALWVHNTGMSATTSLPSASGAALVAALVAGTGVVAISMIIAGIRGRTTGGIGFLGFLGVLALMVTAVLPWGTTYHAFGNNTVTESSPAAFALVGDTTVDLSVYDGDSDQTHVDVTQVAGDIILQVPANRPTEITMDVLAGSIESRDFDWRDHSGIFNRRTFTVNEHAPGSTLHVHARLLAGTITVE